MSSDLFAGNMPRDFWLVRAGSSANSGFLTDNVQGKCKGILVFKSKGAADSEAKAMNSIRQSMKMDMIYIAVKGKQEDVAGCDILLQ
jgi:hypothetical protein